MYQKTTLDNGLCLITSYMPHTHSVCLAFFIGAGACYEIEAEAGISHFIEHILFKGTKKRKTTREISEAIEGVGGIINGGTNKELTSFWCKVADQHFFLALDVLTDLLRNSRFEAEDIGHERQVIIEEINMSLDSPQHRVDLLIDELLWPGQPLGRDIAGTKQTVTDLTRQQMLNFFSQHYLPNNIIVSIAGNIQEELAIESLNRTVGDWKSDEISAVLPSSNNQEAPRLHIEFRDTEQAHLCLGIPGISFFHPDRFALDLLSVVLGEGMSSRLFTSVREQQGLAYDIHSYVDHFTDSGALVIYAGVAPKHVDNALKSILEQLSLLCEDVSESELTKAKELAKGRLLLRLEDNQNVAGWLGSQEILTKRILTIDNIMSLVDTVTTEDLKRIARQLLISKKLNLAVVGPVKKEESLAKLLTL